MLTIAVLLGIVASPVLWTVRGRAAWWVPAFAFGFLGGYVDVGFKIYTHEIGMALSLVGAAWLIADRPRRPEGRPPLDWSVYLLIAFMLAHMAVACGGNLAGRLPGTGSIVRLYVNGLWGLAFAAAFWRYGDLRPFRVALAWATAFAAVRVALGVYALSIPVPDEVRGSRWLYAASPHAINFIDLRASAPALMMLLTIWFYQRSGRFARMVILVAYAAAIWLTLLGASRVATLTVFAIPCLWALLQRRWAGLLGYAVAVATLLAAVNLSPAFFRGLPEGARRSLSPFVRVYNPDETRATLAASTASGPAAGGSAAAGATVDSGLFGRRGKRSETASSNDWHLQLMEAGWRRWTASPVTFIIGRPLEGWRPEYAQPSSVAEMVEVAARLASYESAFLTIAASLGLTGLLLFARVLWWFGRPIAGDIVRFGIRHPDDALVFVAVQSAVIYTGLCWIAGGFPSVQIVMGSLAAALVCDRHSRAERGPA